MRIALILSVLFAFALVASLKAQVSPTALRCEYLENPSVVDVLNPRLSWVNVAKEGERGQLQTAWEIRVASSKDKLLNNQSDLWSSGKVTSNQSTNINYNGKPLLSRQDCWWQVRTWDKKGKASLWSDPAFEHWSCQASIEKKPCPLQRAWFENQTTTESYLKVPLRKGSPTTSLNSLRILN